MHDSSTLHAFHLFFQPIISHSRKKVNNTGDQVIPVILKIWIFLKLYTAFWYVCYLKKAWDCLTCITFYWDPIAGITTQHKCVNKQKQSNSTDYSLENTEKYRLRFFSSSTNCKHYIVKSRPPNNILRMTNDKNLLVGSANTHHFS